MDIYRYDQSWRKKGFGLVAGLDEAGRGPISGPVVASAVIFHKTFRIEGLRDSKKVPEKERESLFWDILASPSEVGVGIVGHDEIDRLNILRATRVAMQRAVHDLRLMPDLLVIDALSLPCLDIKQISPVRAESISASVAAASIVAKYIRDSIMLRYDAIYPEYNFRKHKGYCTGEHLQKIKAYGPCHIHRKSFNKVMSLELPF